ncbi:ATP-dependent DNA helicase [Ideonella sp. A 288]|uniref:ATP-dependent DNA helicase n=1 Tax=Ideonella sp. A 288 TaxID=1962181 RepID=UPI000B4A8934|nr:ATP-dependent DNA helicase [Ideonella sp. A 288]
MSTFETVGAPWTYAVSVRTLCDFTTKQGDLDRRFTPSATALEGIQGQATVAHRRGPHYEAEIVLEGHCGPLRVRGRADGHDPRRGCLEEVKAIRGVPTQLPENRRRLHWAQLETYGALFCRDRGLSELSLALVYLDVATQTEIELTQLVSAVDLNEAYERRCALFLSWAEREARHRASRDASLVQLSFPQASFRAGQRDLAQAVYRAATRRQCLLAQAPTGVGKTLGTLFPLLRAMPGQGIDKIAYLTCKGTGQLAALEALRALRMSTPGQALRVVVMVAKKQACEHPDKACHGDACPLARGFYDRLPAAREQAVADGWLDAAAQRRIALHHHICPYYLGQELVRWADVLVADVHHLFDRHGQLWGLMQSLDWALSVLVDEAHNLIERARRMYSAEIGLRQLQKARQDAPAVVQAPLAGLVRAVEALVRDSTPSRAARFCAPEGFTQALQAAARALSEHFRQQPLAVGPLLSFHFDLQRFQWLIESLNDHSLFDVCMPNPRVGGAAPMDHGTVGADDAVLRVRNVAPACFLRPRFRALHSITLFSATLSPPDHAIELLGLPDDTAWIDLPPAFPAAHLTVQVADGLSTRHAHRIGSLQPLLDVLAAQIDAHPGNYLAFFSSFEYLEQVATALTLRRPDIAQWRQSRRMDAEARRDFLARFQPAGQGIGFAVLGGVFAEGIDLPGAMLVGAFIATLGLPPVSEAQREIQARLDKLYGADRGYGDLIPAMQRVVQAAGRVLRTPEDRGWLWLLDERYRQERVVALLPAWWQIERSGRRNRLWPRGNGAWAVPRAPL